MSKYFSHNLPYAYRPEHVGRYSPQHPLFVLAKELESRSIGASVDASISVVDAYLPAQPDPDCAWLRSSTSSTQRAILRPDPVSAHPWWWLLWPGERFEAELVEPDVERLLPVERTQEVARRIRNILVLDSPV